MEGLFWDQMLLYEEATPPAHASWIEVQPYHPSLTFNSVPVTIGLGISFHPGWCGLNGTPIMKIAGCCDQNVLRVWQVDVFLYSTPHWRCENDLERWKKRCKYFECWPSSKRRKYRTHCRRVGTRSYYHGNEKLCSERFSNKSMDFEAYQIIHRIIPARQKSFQKIREGKQKRSKFRAVWLNVLVSSRPRIKFPNFSIFTWWVSSEIYEAKSEAGPG